MEQNEMENILDLYFKQTRLKENLRQGWVIWNVSGQRIESIAEHIYGSQMIAVAIYSQCELDIDIFKVLSMLSLHETEEVIIGDYTPFDNISEEQKLEEGRLAVKSIFNKSLKKSKMFIELIDEFNERKTAEAKFAFLCDKYECILQLKKYTDEKKCSIVNATARALNDERIKGIISGGATTVLDIFIQSDKRMFKDSIFEELVEFTRKYRIKS